MTINPAVYASCLCARGATSRHPRCSEFPLLLVVGAEQPVKSIREAGQYGRANPALANYASKAPRRSKPRPSCSINAPARIPACPVSRQRRCGAGGGGRPGADDVAELRPDRGAFEGGQAARSASPPPSAIRRCPTLPTMEGEAGLADLEIALWTGIVAPAGTPTDIVATLNRAIQQALGLPEVKTAMAATPSSRAAPRQRRIRDLIARDARWKAVATAASIKARGGRDGQHHNRSPPFDGALSFLEGLNELGLDYLFCNFGTDHAPIIEAMAAFKRGGRKVPRPSCVRTRSRRSTWRRVTLSRPAAARA